MKISVFLFQNKLEANHVLRYTNVFKSLTLLSVISTTACDKEDQDYFFLK